MIFTLDTNILVYAFDRLNPEKRDLSREIFSRLAGSDFILTTQVLGEFLGVVRRKNIAAYADATALVESWSQLFPVVDTTPVHLLAAAALADRYRLQFWDSVIIAAAASANVTMLFTEDIQDGQEIDGVTLLDPFAATNRDRVAALLAA